VLTPRAPWTPPARRFSLNSRSRSDRPPLPVTPVPRVRISLGSPRDRSRSGRFYVSPVVRREAPTLRGPIVDADTVSDADAVTGPGADAVTDAAPASMDTGPFR
jgi:hypothetical protein